MLKNKNFWYGFLIAYVVAIFLPPSKIMGSRGKKG
jgi:hypothetical protein